MDPGRVGGEGVWRKGNGGQRGQRSLTGPCSWNSSLENACFIRSCTSVAQCRGMVFLCAPSNRQREGGKTGREQGKLVTAHGRQDPCQPCGDGADGSNSNVWGSLLVWGECNFALLMVGEVQ